MAFDPSVYEQKRRSIGNQYTSQAAVNALGRFNAQQRGDRTAFDYRQNYQKQTPMFTSSWGQRGMTGSGVKSGVYQNALNSYVTDYQTGANRMYADTQNELNEYDMNAANLATERDRAYADLEVDKAREIANAAQYLEQLRRQYGGT
jgi:hypothetical protein